ncbi:hypothetical protein HJC23_003385 [Cyclotella cryptica]|uniref:BolA-like protein n=1 Tax=Cyclotella cryptica TaxID=29204 RepID=A0ABD3QXY8_9STRA
MLSSNLFRRIQIRSIMSNNTSGPVADAIKEKLTAAFTPLHLEVRNESHMHKIFHSNSTFSRSRFDNRPKGSETHFKVIVVSTKFNEARTPIAKHRLVNDVLREEVAGPVHALSIVAMTPEKWQETLEKGEMIGASPSCRGGDGSLPKRN